MQHTFHQWKTIHLAIDTGIQDILITGDFNFNMLNVQSSYKIKDLCEQNVLKQTTNEPTHFTEHSSSLLGIILTTNENHLIFTGVGGPFLAQEMRYHYHVYGIFNFSKPKHKSFVRHTWSFEQGDYSILREKASLTNWDNLYDADQDQDQDSLLVKHRNDNHSPGPVIRELVPSSHQISELSNTILCIFSR